MSKRMNGETVFSDEGLERAVAPPARALEGPRWERFPATPPGTLSASAGLAWVGESGTELVGVSGGERVYTATQSAALAGAAGSGGSVQVINHNTIDASNLAQINRLAELMAGERMSMRMGYAGGR